MTLKTFGIKKIMISTLLMLLSGIVFSQALQTQTPGQFFSGKKLHNGVDLVTDASINQSTFAKQYAKNKTLWDKALSWLTTTDLATIVPGKYVIAGDSVFAFVTENPTKTKDMAKWEAHRKYIDVHCVISGEENIQSAPISTAAVSQPYDEKADIENFNTQGQTHLAKPGQVFIFFPADVHRPNLKVDGIEKDRKVVIKILYAD